MWFSTHSDRVRSRKAAYLRTRKITAKLQSDIARQIPRDVLREAGTALGLLKRGTLVLHNETEMAILMEYASYEVRRGGKNRVQLYAERSKLPGGDPGLPERLALDCMCQAQYGLFHIENVLDNVTLRMVDVFRNVSRLVIDTGLAATVAEPSMFAARLYPVANVPDYWMTSGAGLPVYKDGGDAVMRRISGWAPANARVPLQLSSSGWTEFATMCIKTLLKHQASSWMQLGEAGRPMAASDKRHRGFGT